MDLIYAGGEISAREIWRQLPDAPTYSTVRTLLGVLETKGHVRRKAESKAHLYRATRPRENAAAAAVRRLVQTFFSGSVEHAVSGLLELEEADLTEEELTRISRLINAARKEKKS